MPGRNPPDLNVTLSRFSPLAPMLARPAIGLKTRHGEINLAGRSAVMGVLNVTPDSFFDGGRHFDLCKAIAAGVVMASSGADIIDVGGESTRPGAQTVSETDELARVLPVIQGLRKEVSLPISIDTGKSAVARAALDAGADIINDISALRFDRSMIGLAARENVPVILMHMQGTPQTMQKEPQYTDVVREVRDFLAAQLYEATDAGLASESVLLDPGIGFGKTLDHNLQLLRGLPALAALGQPLLVGVSRKAFIGKLLNVTADERLEGSLAAAVVAALNGANILRVHDVAETSRALRIADAIRFGASS